MGIDRLSISGPVGEFEREKSAWNSVTDKMPGSESGRLVYGGSVNVGGAKAFVGVAVIRATGQAVGKVEFNPSRIIDPEGVGLADVEDSKGAAQLVWSAARELVGWSGDLETSKVRRLDVARDFEGISNPATLIRQLAPIHRPWARRNLVHADPSKKGAQTLMVGSGSGVVRLYDKFAESLGQAPLGTVRWEAECRSNWVREYGSMSVFADIDRERVRQVAANRWEWSAMGSEVGAVARVIERVKESELTDRERVSFLGWLMEQAHGGSWEPAKATLAKYRKVQRDLGIALDDLEGGSAIVTRLDFESGREVMRVA